MCEDAAEGSCKFTVGELLDCLEICAGSRDTCAFVALPDSCGSTSDDCVPL